MWEPTYLRPSQMAAAKSQVQYQETDDGDSDELDPVLDADLIRNILIAKKEDEAGLGIPYDPNEL